MNMFRIPPKKSAQIVYLTAAMPQHHDCILALAYDVLNPQITRAEIDACLYALSHDDFTVANDAYLTLREYKTVGQIQYAIAQTRSEALRQLAQLLSHQPKWMPSVFINSGREIAHCAIEN